jgi:DNA-directed RNA polymerase specialized sigma24 family protein
LTAPGAFAASSAVFNDRRRLSMGETARGSGRVALAMSAGRREQIGSLYERHAESVRRAVGGRVNAPRAVVEDACHTAWLRLCAHEDVALDPRSVVKWLVVTGTRECWRRTTGCRELAMGGWLPDGGERELPEPAGDACDPSVIVGRRDLVRSRLAALSDRERQFLALQALGLSYEEISTALEVTVRTVERQILRGRRKLRDGGEAV